MPSTRHEIELALNSSAYKRVLKAQENVFGGEFWHKSYRDASKHLKKHMQSVHKIGEKTSEKISREFDGMFKKTAEGFGAEVEGAAQVGSKAYVQAMKRAVSKVAQVKAKSEADRAKATKGIIKQELKGLQKRLKLEAKGSKEAKLRGRAADFKERTDKISGALTRGGEKISGPLGGMLSSAGKSVKGMGKFAGVAGAALGASAALGILAKKALDIQSSIKGLNTQMVQSISASDLVSGGFVSVSEGVTLLRKEFMLGTRENIKWKMSTEEAYSALNSLTSTGVTLSKVNLQMGRDVQSTGQTARDMVNIIRTYSNQLSTEVGSIGSFMGDLMLNLNYSMGEVASSLAVIDNNEHRSSISTGIFFSKIQSVNTQLGLMNANLAVQADVFANVVKKGPLGLEQAATAAANIMGELDDQAAGNVLAFVGEAKALALMRKELSRVDARLATEGLDSTLIKLLEITSSQLSRAIEGSLGERMQGFSGGMMSEIANLDPRFAVFAQILGKSQESLTADEFVNVSFGNQELIKSNAVLGTTNKEVNQNLAAMAAQLGDGGGTEALDRMYTDSMKPMAEAISEDMRLARSMLAETEDVSKILTSIKDWLMADLYQVLSGMHSIMVNTLGSDQDVALLEYDKVLRNAMSERETSTGPRSERLDEIIADVRGERETIGKFSEYDMGQFTKGYGGGNLEAALGSRLGTGRSNLSKGGSGGALTYSERALSAPLTNAPTLSSKSRASIKSDMDQRTNTGNFLEMDAANILADHNLNVADIREVMTSNQGAGAWAAWAQSHPNESNEVLALKYAQNMGAIQSPTKFAKDNNLPALADGGIVSRPTLALIGESGPEAVVPLGKSQGKFELNVHGSIYGMDELRGIINKAFLQYSRSRRA